MWNSETFVDGRGKFALVDGVLLDLLVEILTFIVPGELCPPYFIWFSSFVSAFVCEAEAVVF